MNIVQVAGFTTLGREARTSNEKESKGEGVIGPMWASGAPKSSPIVAVYSEYGSDKNGEYNYMLGRKMMEDETLPQEVTHRRVVGGDYLRLDFRGSVSPEAVVGLWRQIWEMENKGEIQRAYRTDFELYGDNGFELFVGVKAS